MLLVVLDARPSAAAPYKLAMFHAKDGTAIEYALVLPESIKTGQPMPALIAFPMGEQEEYEALQGLQHYWGSAAAQRGWLSVTMLAPAGLKLHLDGAAYVPELLDEIEASYPIEGGKWHAVGYSDGGFGAFRAAIENPQRFHSLVVFPGGPSRAEEIVILDRLAPVVVRFFTGSNDAQMVQLCQRTAERIRKSGGDAIATVFEGEAHVPASITSDRLLDELARARDLALARMANRPGATPESLLDEFIAAGGAADARRFFDCFAPDSEMLWMDFPARMNLKALRKIAEPHMNSGEPLALTPLDTHVELMDGGRAWFDQALITPKGDPCRATGVMVQGPMGWRIWRMGMSCRPIVSSARDAGLITAAPAQPAAPVADEAKPAEKSSGSRSRPPR